MSAYPVEDWIKKAEDNYISALALVRRRNQRVPDVVCNQCQQAAEKYLKALLVWHALDFPKTHDLRQLEDLLFSAAADVRLIDEQLQLLNPYGIDIRYPGRQATLEEAKEAVKAMKQVRQFARAKLGLKGK